jgi:hypothetical protein
LPFSSSSLAGRAKEIKVDPADKAMLPVGARCWNLGCSKLVGAVDGPRVTPSPVMKKETVDGKTVAKFSGVTYSFTCACHKQQAIGAKTKLKEMFSHLANADAVFTAYLAAARKEAEAKFTKKADDVAAAGEGRS